MAQTKKPKIQVAFAAIGKTFEQNYPEPTQKEVTGKLYIPYGRDNLYPEYLLSLYKSVSTLKAIIDGNVNYVMGSDFQVKDTEMMTDTEVEELLRECIRDWYIFGYCFIQVMRNPFGEVVGIVRIPAELIRTDKDHQAFWYSEKWQKGGKAVIYPAFVPNAETSESTVYMIGKGRGTYPEPLWSAAVKDAEMERKIEEFHLNELSNNFMSSAIINFNNGVPTDEVKLDLERAFQEKFSGSSNGGRVVLCFNENVTNRTTIDRLASDNFDTRYQALASRTREQLFVAFKCQPILFGLTSETNTGFSTQEFNDLFQLYNKTMILPVQKMFERAFAHVTGMDDFIHFNPFVI